MRIYYDIDLADHAITRRELHGEEIVKAGRYLIAKTLLEEGAATVDPLSPANPLIFSAGPFAGTAFSNANRTSVGCKSPLTGGIKEANGGGTFSYALGQLQIAGFTLRDASPDWVVLHFRKDGTIGFDDATPVSWQGQVRDCGDALRTLLQEGGHCRLRPGRRIPGPAGRHRLQRPRGASHPPRRRGGVGAVMGSKKVKAIVVDLDKIPPLHDKKKVNGDIKTYAQKLQADSVVMNFYNKVGTMGMADYQNYIGGLPVRNFTGGQLADVSAGETFKMGGDYIGELNTSRGGEQTHACMPGCVIQCSNIYHDAEGKEVVSRRSSTKRSASSAPTAASPIPISWRS